MRKKFFLFAPALILFFPAIVFAATDHLVISQVQINGGTGHSNDDFVELFNPTSSGIDLNGLILVRRTKAAQTDEIIKSWNDSVIIPAYSYFLISHPDYSGFISNDRFDVGKLLAPDNGIALRQGLSNVGTIIDTLAWGTVTNGLGRGSIPTSPGANKALTRKFDAQNIIQDTDSNSVDFKSITATPHNLSSEPNPPIENPPPAEPPPSEQPPAEQPPADEPPAQEPPAEEPPPAETPPAEEPVVEPGFSPDILISEILPNPDGKDDGEEWTEFFNKSDAEVDVSGWIVDDEGNEIGKDAYVFPDGSLIRAKSYLVANLPIDSFALNNTGGDSVRLFWPDNNLAQTVVYADSAKEDETYALKSPGVYAWTSLVTKGEANKFPENFVAELTSPADQNIKINEIFPNPAGPDSGAEWIELTNLGTEPVMIHNWVLDDGNPSDAIGESAWKIQSPIVYPGQVAVLTIPSGKFSMNNTADTVRIFNAKNYLIDSVAFQDAVEDKSYAIVSGKWIWTKPSPNAVNFAEEIEKSFSGKIVINELFPEPAKGGEEFIELLNQSEEEISTEGFVLSDLATSYKLPATTIPPHDFLVIKKADSQIALNNSGKEQVTLKDAKGTVLAVVEYEDAPKNMSFNLTDAGIYVWSTVLTPGTQNQFKNSPIEMGLVKGAILPRTGNDSGLDVQNTIVFWIVVWYIYIKLCDPNPRIASECHE